MTTSIPIERRGRRARRTLLVLSTILASGVTVPALAQSSPHPNLDANGVDLTTGQFSLALPVGSIGSGAATLALTAYSGTSDNWSGLTLYRTVSGGMVRYTVNLGLAYDNFSSAAGAASTRGTGATLSEDGGGSFTYRTLDGQTIVFGNPAEQQGGASNLCDDYNVTGAACTALATSVSGRSGMTADLDWTISANCARQLNPDDSVDCSYSWRLGGVANSAGYRIGFGYASDAVPLRQNPGPAWYRRTSATFANTVSGGARRVASYGYPAAAVYTITTPGGRQWRITGDSPQITAVQRPGASGASTTIAYGGYGVVSQVVRNGVATSYARSVSGNSATMVVTDAQNHATTVVSDLARFRPVSVTDPLNRQTTYAYDATGRPTDVTVPEGNGVHYGYDGRGNLIETRVKAKPGSGQPDLVSSASYPAACTDAACNEPIWTQDAKGNRTDYAYDANGLVTSVTAPAASAGGVRPQVRYGYAVSGGVSLVASVSACRTSAACADGADEVRTVVGYDANLQLASVTRRSGDGSLAATTTAAYDPDGNVASVDGPLAGAEDVVRYRYDPDRLAVGTVAPDPDGSGPRKRRAQRTGYNGDGQATLVEAGTVGGPSDADWSAFASLQQAGTTYDANGRAVTTTLAAGGTTYRLSQQSYDAAGRVACVVTRMNPGAFGSLPGSACTLGTPGSAGPDRITRTTYDAAGQVTGVTQADGTADAATEHQAYTGNGQVASVTDANGNVTTAGYDGYDRAQTTTYPGGSYESLGYDANGNVVSRRLRDGQVLGYSYDALDRRTYDDNPDTNVAERDVSYGYDLLGRLTQATDGNGWYKAYEYDALGRVTRERSNVGDNRFGYDLAGRRVRQAWADGFYVTDEYDAAGNMTAIRENGSGLLASFGYDDLGRRTSLTRGNGTVTTYGYDAASRLATLGQDLAGTASDQVVTLGYNPAGQVTSRTGSNDAYAWTGHYNVDRTYGVNGLNQLTSAGSTALGYDARGNLVSAGGSSYGYNTRNQLFTGPGGELIYRGPSGELSQVPAANLDWAGGQLASELAPDLEGAVQRRYVYGPDADEPLVSYQGAGTGDKRWLAADERGSIVAVTDASGTATAINSYDEYGVPASTNLGRFGYTGQVWLPQVGLYDYKARMYSPTLGRFMQTDPIGYADGMNWYAYVHSDPVNFTDPSGMDCAKKAVSPGSRIPRCVDSNGGGGTGRSPGNSLSFRGGGGGLSGGFYICTNCGPSTIAANGDIIVTAPTYQFVSFPSVAYLFLTIYSNNYQTASAPQNETCSAAGDILGSTVVDRVGDVHGSIFAAGQTMASKAGNEAGAVSIGRAALPGAVLLSGLSEGMGAASDRAAGMSAGRATAIHGTGFVGGLLGGFALGELVEPLGGGIVGAVVAGIAGGYGGGKIGEATGAAAATGLGYCK